MSRARGHRAVHGAGDHDPDGRAEAARLILGSFIAIYGIARIIGEHFREPDPQLGFLWGGLTMGMLLSVPMIIVGAIIITAALRRKANGPAPSST